MRPLDNLVFQYLHQPRLPNPRLSTEHDYLAQTVLELRPELTEKGEFSLPAHKRGEAFRGCNGKPAWSRALLLENLEDPLWFRSIV
jgi:hypothetical protein